MERPFPVRNEDNLASIWRPVGKDVGHRIVGKLSFHPRLPVEEPEFMIAGAIRMVNDPLTVRRKASGGIGPRMKGEPLLGGILQGHHVKIGLVAEFVVKQSLISPRRGKYASNKMSVAGSQLPQPAGTDVNFPEAYLPGPIRRKDDSPAVHRPGRLAVVIFVIEQRVRFTS
ncbi:MAG: hypothetical protein ACYTEW_25235 [Planctomycetota bacterium]